MYYITATQPAWAAAEHSLSNFRWLESDEGTAGTSTVGDMVEFIEAGGTVKIAGESGPSGVGIYELNGKKHLRSYADGEFDNNLLSLPRIS